MKKGMRYSLVVTTLGISLLFGATAGESKTEKTTESTTTKKVNLAKGINQFSFDLLHQLAAKSTTGKNMVVSPQSIYNNLAINYVGSEDKTRDELAKVLHYPKDDIDLLNNLKKLNQEMTETSKSKYVRYYTANGIWIDKSRVTFFKEDYLALIKKYFPTALCEAQFGDPGVKDKINRWVEKSTNNRIKNLLTRNFSIKDFAMININTIYFHAAWEMKFDKKETRKKKFYTTDTKFSEVQMMRQEAELEYSSNDDFQFLKLPYTDGFSMCLFLPKERESVKDFVKKITPEIMKKLDESLFYYTVDLSLPRFKLSQKLNVKNYLKQMGVKDAFDISVANFNKMYTKAIGRNLYIRHVFQKTNICVNEAGTVASTATDSDDDDDDSDEPPKIVKFNANHPFVFMIVNNENKNIVFTGWYSNPEKK